MLLPPCMVAFHLLLVVQLCQVFVKFFAVLFTTKSLQYLCCPLRVLNSTIVFTISTSLLINTLDAAIAFCQLRISQLFSFLASCFRTHITYMSEHQFLILNTQYRQLNQYSVVIHNIYLLLTAVSGYPARRSVFHLVKHYVTDIF